MNCSERSILFARFERSRYGQCCGNSSLSWRWILQVALLEVICRKVAIKIMANFISVFKPWFDGCYRGLMLSDILIIETQTWIDEILHEIRCIDNWSLGCPNYASRLFGRRHAYGKSSKDQNFTKHAHEYASLIQIGICVNLHLAKHVCVRTTTFCFLFPIELY